MITIRPTQLHELPQLMALFESAKGIMRASGNHRQWTSDYPGADLVRRDIEQGHSYVCHDQGLLVGTFSFIPGADPTYAHIYQGQWLDDHQPYATLHRLASTPESHGVAQACLEWCSRQCPNLRADTHRDNRILQHILQKHGFQYCGIIYLANGDERLAYQRLG